MIRLRARWLFPGDSPPVPQAVLSLDGDRIDSITTGSSISAIDLGDVALVPGLLNAHTHLEFSNLSLPLEPRRHFAEWIQTVIENRRSRTPEIASTITQGLQESHSCSVAALAETATSNWILETPPEEFPRVLAFREILGLRPEGVARQLEIAQSFLDQAEQLGPHKPGISPHAPYSLHPDLFHGLCDLAQVRQVPLSMHLAESPAELELLQQGTGPLVDLFTRMGIWQPGVIPLGTRPLHYLKGLVRAPRVLVVHGNLLDDEEIRFIASQPHFFVVYCPRTHQAMQSSRHPWRELLRRGIKVVLGTDSRASNPDLSLWNELQFLQKQAADLPASTLLKLATSRAAQALGWNDLGRLAAGCRAQVGLVPLSARGLNAPEQFLFEHPIERLPEHILRT